jgi:ABC-type antimicrobial peptide transport system permease subunit
MQRTLVSFFGIALGLALLFTITANLAFGQTATPSKTQTVAKAESSEDSMAKMDSIVKSDSAAKLEPVVKVTAQKAEIHDSILPAPDGNELADSCKAQAEGFDAGYCLGVVEGVISSMKLCKRDRSVITLGEAADATSKYLANHPEKLRERDVVVARKALSEAYPCNGSRR